MSLTPSPTDALSGMDTKRVGLEPTPTSFPQPQDVANAVLYGYPFGYVYKEGSVWNRPLRYFRNHGTSAPRKLGVLRKDADPYTG